MYGIESKGWSRAEAGTKGDVAGAGPADPTSQTPPPLFYSPPRRPATPGLLSRVVGEIIFYGRPQHGSGNTQRIAEFGSRRRAASTRYVHLPPGDTYVSGGDYEQEWGAALTVPRFLGPPGGLGASRIGIEGNRRSPSRWYREGYNLFGGWSLPRFASFTCIAVSGSF